MKKLLIILCVFLLSCGTRKAELDLQKVRTKELSELVFQLQKDIQANVRVIKKANTTKLEPIDPNKPSTFNGKEFQNTKVTLTEKESDSVASSSDQSKLSGESTTEKDILEKAKKKNSNSDRGDPWTSIGLPVALCIGLAIILFVFYRFKKK